MRLRVAAFAGLGCLPLAASAVVLDARGTGQVLIFPYYTVNGGNTTLITIGNSSAKGKALKIRFRESYNGRDVRDFNIYLSPFDTWTTGLFQLNADGPANLVTDDNSCTSPTIKGGTSPSLGTLPDGRRYVPFSNAAFTGAYEDTGPTALTRAREGFFEVIEMGEVTDGTFNSLQAITQVGMTGVPKNCAQIANAWVAPGGYWVVSPTADLTPPGGGLFGSAAIVNVGQGTMATYNADALDGFSDRIQHTLSGTAHPTLADAVTDSAANIASAYIPIDTRLLRADYPAATRGIDAVSAVLASESLFNEFLELSGGAAHSEWVVSFPTKQFYVDPDLVGTVEAARPPFWSLFGEVDDAVSCVRFDPRIVDREGRTPREPEIIFIGPPIPPNDLCWQTHVITFLPASAAASRNPSPFLGSRLSFNIDPENAVSSTTGWLRLGLDPEQERHRMRPSAAGDVFFGLPAIGFLLVNYTNGNVTPGVLANYSGTLPHRGRIRCSATGASSPCAAAAAPNADRR